MAVKNIFIQRILQGKLHSQDQLKSLFRKEALRLHPDTSASDGRIFAELRAHYEEALSYLLDGSGHSPANAKKDTEDKKEKSAAEDAVHPQKRREQFYLTWGRFLYRNHFGSLGKLRLTSHYEQSLGRLRETLGVYAPQMLEDFRRADRIMALLRQGAPHEKRARELWDRAFRSLSTYDDGLERNLRIADSCAGDAHSYLSLGVPRREGFESIQAFYQFLREDISEHGPTFSSWTHENLG